MRAPAPSALALRSQRLPRWQLYPAPSQSRYCNNSAFDQLFILINAASEFAGAFNRQEWLQCLVRFAMMRYVLPRVIKSAAAALKELITVDLKPKVANTPPPPQALTLTLNPSP